MLLLAALLGLVILAAAVAAPPFREETEALEGPTDAWTNGPVWEGGSRRAEAGERPCARDAEMRSAPEECGIAGARIGAEGGENGVEGGEEYPACGGSDRPRDDAPPPVPEATTGNTRTDPQTGAPLIPDFDPAVETIEIAYAGDAPPELQFVETDEATEVLVDGVVVARMAGVTGLDSSHVSLIAA